MAWLLGAGAAGAAVAAAADATAETSGPNHISEIVIRPENVFTRREAGEALVPFRLMNAIHVTTRRGFIQRELLFQVGDSLNLERFRESERNLRRLRIFRSVAITADSSRVLVETQDAWTARPRLAAARRGGVLTYSLGLEDHNLAGTGRQIELRYDRGTERLARSIAFADPQAFAPHVELAVEASHLSDGSSAGLAFGRPFYALDVRHAAGVLWFVSSADTTLYAGGAAEARWRKLRRYLRVEAGRKIGGGESSAWRLYAGAEWDEARLRSGDFGPAPADSTRRFLWFVGAVERQGRHWIVRRNVEQMDRDEDIDLSASGRFEIAASPRLREGRQAARFRISAATGTRIGAAFARLTLSGEARREATWRQQAVSLEGRTAWPIGDRLTVIGHAGWAGGWNLDPEVRLTLDGANGVRGYRIHAATGTRRGVANLEARARIASDVVHLFSLGAVAFADGGVSAGPPDGTVRLADAGLGLRLGLTRAGTHTLLRFDLARALRPDPEGRREWLWSFGTGQAF